MFKNIVRISCLTLATMCSGKILNMRRSYEKKIIIMKSKSGSMRYQTVNFPSIIQKLSFVYTCFYVYLLKFLK